MDAPTPNQLWRRARGDRTRYLELLRAWGYIYERADGATVHTAANRADVQLALLAIPA
jgi:hypothetical protein